MFWIVTKYMITAGLVVAISELAKRNEKLGALLTALPLIAILSLIWLYVEKQPSERIAAYASATFWYVLPTLPMFLVFPTIQIRLGFWLALLLGILLTVLCFTVLILFLRRSGVDFL